MFDRDIGTTPALTVIQVKETHQRWEQGPIGRVVRPQGNSWRVSRRRRLLFWAGHVLTSLGKRLQQYGSPWPGGQTLDRPGPLNSDDSRPLQAVSSDPFFLL